VKKIMSPDEARANFSKLGSSVFMVQAPVGLGLVDVATAAKRMERVWWKWRKKPNGNISELLREIASVAAAVSKLRDAERRGRCAE
jgi:hypothetical protein